MLSGLFGLRFEKRRECWLIYHRRWGVLDCAIIAFVVVEDATVEVGGGLPIEFMIRKDVGFAAGADGRANDPVAVCSDFFDGLCAYSGYFFSITSQSMMSQIRSGDTACPFRRRQSCFALIKI